MYLKMGTLAIHYKISGSSGSPILLLHGWGNDLTSFTALAHHLAQQFTVYSIDLPGFGFSSKPENPWNTEDYASFIKQLLIALNLSSVILIGHSLGARIAIRLASQLSSQYEPKIAKLILLASAGIRPKRHLRYYYRVYRYKLLKNIAKLPPLSLLLRPYIHQYQQKAGSKDYQKASGVMRQILIKIVNEDIRHLLPHIDIPTLLVWGENDQETPLQQGLFMQQLIPHSKLITIANAGHHPHQDQLSLVCDNIDLFLKNQ